MSEKISINLEIPGINMMHNYLVPDNMNIATMTMLIMQTLSDEYKSVECGDFGNRLLIQAKTGKVLDRDYNLKQLGVADGEIIILI